MTNDLISYRASIGMFYCSIHCIYVYTNVIVSISPIDEIFYLLGLLVNLISTCFVKCKLHIDNIQFFLLLWSIVLLANDVAENPGPETNDTISSGLTIFHLNIRSIIPIDAL
jgi:hypothetical protein